VALTDTGDDGSPAREPDPALAASASPVTTSEDPAAEADAAASAPDTAPAPPARPGGRRLPTALIITAAGAILVAAAVTTGGVLAASGSPPVRTPPRDRALTAAQRAAAKVTAATSTFSLQISGPFAAAETGTLALEFRPLRIEASLTLTAYGQSDALTEIITGGGVYLQSASMFGSTSSSPWALIRSGTLNPRSVFADLLPSAQTADPIAQYLLALRARQLRGAGEQIIAGVDAARYTGSYSARSSLRYLPATVRGGMARDLKQVDGDVAFTVWIGGQNEIRQISQAQELTTGARSLPPLAVSETCTITSLNQPVHIALPPPGELFIPPPSQINGTRL
jgi:hypothetical protein